MRDDQDHRLDALWHRLQDVSNRDHVVVRDVVVAIGRRSMVPFLLVPAFLAATPLSGIPGLSTMCGLIIVLVSVRMLMDFDHMALPKWIEGKSLEGEKLRKVFKTSAPFVHWINRHSRTRWSWMFQKSFIWLPQTLCLLSGLSMPFLEFIPFTASIAAAGVCVLALSMFIRDGRLFLIGLVPYLALIYFAVTRIA